MPPNFLLQVFATFLSEYVHAKFVALACLVCSVAHLI